MYTWERKIYDILIHYATEITLILVTVLAFLVRSKGMDYVSNDMEVHLFNWFAALEAEGGIAGLKYQIGDYYIPYLLLMSLMTYLPLTPLAAIKVLSVFFEFTCAFAAMKLAYDLTGGDKQSKKIMAAAIYTLTIFSPLVILDGAFWGQCDYIYATFIILSLSFFQQKNFRLSFVFLGIAFVFKLQTAFIMPAYFLYYLLNKEYSVLKFLWIPVVYIITGLPAIIAGRHYLNVYSIYYDQTNSTGKLVKNVPNIWQFFPVEEYQAFEILGIGSVLIFLAVAAIYLLNRNYRLNFQTFLLMGIVIESLCVLILPGMHERYVAVLCLLTTIYFMIYDRKRIWVFLVFTASALMTYIYYLYKIELFDQYKGFSILNLITFLYLCSYALKTIAAANANHSAVENALKN